MPRFFPRRLVAGLCVLLSACALLGQATHSNYLKVQEGMDEWAVYSLLGEPDEVLSLGFAGLGGSHSAWKNQGAVITIQFLNGKVMGKQYISY